MNRIRIGMAALLAGGVLTGGLLLGGTLVSAQTPDETPAVETSQTPPATPDQTTPDDGSTTPQDRQQSDHKCDMDGDGQSGAGMHRDGTTIPDGASFRSMGTRGTFRQ